MMKRITVVLLLLSLTLLCWGCSKEQPEATGSPQIHYEDTNAYYTQGGGEYTMDLRFQEPVAAGSEICLLLGEEKILGFTTEAAFSHLRLCSPELELNQPYTLTVNGKAQKHGPKNLREEFPQPGDIPEPSLPTIPMEPMADATEPPVQDDGIKEPISFDDPPAGFNGDIAVGEIPSLYPPVESGGLLPSEPFTPGNGNDDSGSLNPGSALGKEYNTFTLTKTVTEFTSVR